MASFMLDDEDEDGRTGTTVERALIGAAAVAATAGLAYFVARTLGGNSERATISDAPPSTLRRGYKPSDALVSRTVTIARPAQELYDFWRRFENLAAFMDNVKSVETLDARRSRWTIAAPGGTEIQFVSRITEDQPGRVIAWESEADATIRNSGRVEFLDAAPGRGTMVRATIDYDPPFGTLGRAVAKLLQREPNVQARRDLRRFKQLMETGEVTSSASPSARRSEEPTKQYL